MKIKSLIFFSALLFTMLAVSGCYTVLNNPHAVADLHQSEVAYADEGGSEAAPTSGQFDEQDDFYRYPGVRGSYGGYGGGGYGRGGYGGYGYPVGGGYSSGGYGGGYGGNYDPYYSGGYGPNSYGYDPYYRDSAGFYVPPGFELVSTRELDQLRIGGLSAGTPTVDPAAAAVLKKREENIWMKRVEPQVRRAPTPTPRATTASTTRRPPTTSIKPAAASAPASASKSTPTKTKAKPKKRRY